MPVATVARQTRGTKAQHSAKLSGHDPYAYLKDVLARLPTQPAGRIEEQLLHRWQPGTAY
jgi:hypothetical protein